ncbi:MAG: hypothetical protein ABUK01_15225 [Leptospirales bacterium]
MISLSPWKYFLIFSITTYSVVTYALTGIQKESEPALWNESVLQPEKELVYPEPGEFDEEEKEYNEKEENKNNSEYRSDESKIKIYGGNNLSFSYGRSHFLGKKDQMNAYSVPGSNAILEGLAPGMDMKIKLSGEVDEQVFFDIDYDQNDTYNNNEVTIQYRSKDKDKFVQEITFGKINLNINSSELVFPDSSAYSALGVDIKLKHKKWEFETVGSVAESVHHLETFHGYRRNQTLYKPDYEYAARKFYQLEPFLYYDNLSSAPSSLSAQVYTRGDSSALNIFTSPSTQYTVRSVSIDPRSLEVYMDDRNPANDTSRKAFVKTVSGNTLGNFHKMRQTREYTVQFKTGRIKFIQPLPPGAKVFVRYTRNNGSTTTTDPSARISNNKIETFLRYANEMHEDILYDGVASFTGSDDQEFIPDGVVNLDVYEIRGVYNLGVEDIDQHTFQMNFVTKNLEDYGSQFSAAYQVDYQKGFIYFSEREPFRSQKDISKSYVYSDDLVRTIYNETHSPYISENSNVYLQLEFEGKIRSFQLSHMNIVPMSESVRVNRMPVDRALYSIDYQTGYFQFLNPDNPLITEATQIEIQYDYLPFGAGEQSYIVGGRTEYHPNENLTFGGSVFYESEIFPDASPYVGEEPGSTFIAAGDVRISMDEKSMTRLVHALNPKSDSRVPVEFEAYGEYARSYYNMNTKGRAIIDDMESSEESIHANLIAGYWVPGSLPPASAYTQCNRAPLYYKHYFDPKNYLRGLLSFSAGAKATPAYSKVAGPYNVAEGHLYNKQVDTSKTGKQTSLVFDFNFGAAPVNTTPFVSAMSDSFAKPGRDFSYVEYVEFSVLLINDGNLASGVNIVLDVGSLKEDADDDDIWDSEDIGLDHINGDTNYNNILDSGENWDNGEKNGVIDYARATGNTEDRGYAHSPSGCSGANTNVGRGPDISGFPSTIGNGILNSEDINKNGSLDLSERAIRIEPSQLYITMDTGADNKVYPGDWTKIRFYFDPSNLTASQKSVLRNVENMRLIVAPNVGAEAGQGKLLVDGIKFGSSLWRNKYAKKWLDSTESSLTDLSVLRTSIINTKSNKDEYYKESFLLQKTAGYELLHGPKTIEELHYTLEGTLKLEYNLDSTYESAFATRNFTGKFDISHYRLIQLWVNHRDYNSSLGYLVLRVGSSENDYYEYTYPVFKTEWDRISFALSKPDSVVGKPDLRQVNYMAVGLKKDPAETGSFTGESWINDIFVSDPELISDYAYLYSSSIRITEPLIKTADGKPILGNFQAGYYKRKKNYQFRSIGDNDLSQMEEEERFTLATRVLPFWQASYTYGQNVTDTPYVTSTEDGVAALRTKTYHNTNHAFITKNKFIPNVIASYEFSNTGYYSDTFLNASSSDTVVYNRNIQRQYTPHLILQKTEIPIGKLKLDYELHAGASMEVNAQKRIHETNNIKKMQYQNEAKTQNDTGSALLNLSGKFFKLTPFISYSQSRLVSKNFTDEANMTTPSSSFYTPFFSEPDNFRYENRLTQMKLNLFFKKLLVFAPILTWTFVYKEDNFYDRQDFVLKDNFQRLKQPSTLSKFTFYLPLHEKVLKKISFLESSLLYFDREIILEEKGVPFTKMSSLTQDRFGFNRISPLLTDRTFNLFRYPFWYFLTSPQNSKRNYSRGRDYIYNSQYNPVDGKNDSNDLFQRYNNSLFLKENISFSSRWIISKPVTLQTIGRIAHIAFRENLYGTPIQNLDLGYSFISTMDMNKLMKIWPWTYKGKSSSHWSIGFNHDILKHITENIEETIISPETTLNYTWFDKKKIINGVALSFSMGRHSYKHYSFIRRQGSIEDREMYDAISNSLNYLMNRIDYTYHYGIEYFTELPGLKKFITKKLKMKLDHNPKYNIGLSADFNRFDYELRSLLDRRALDQFIMNQLFDINLHQNVNGLFSVILVYDIHRNPASEKIMQKVFSYQLGFSANLLF